MSVQSQITRLVGSTSIKNMEISIEKLLEIGCIKKLSTINELLEVCREYDKVELENYLDAKVEQNYGGQDEM